MRKLLTPFLQTKKPTLATYVPTMTSNEILYEWERQSGSRVIRKLEISSF